MRVVRTEGSDGEDWVPRLCTHDGRQPYAILSHRWNQEAHYEVLFADIEEVDRIAAESISNAPERIVKNSQFSGVHPNTKPEFQKLQGAARQALKKGYDYLWVDTCCIDKSSSAELSEAINSMWKWYESSVECFVYLKDVPDLTSQAKETIFAKSEWWTRGWTLQELLAPQDLTFFSSTWTAIGRKKFMDIAISEITGINSNVLNGTVTLDSICIAQRMSWYNKRVTTRIEDNAYALMGLFSVNMPLLYGEGENAFFRLQQEIMKDSDDESIFAWKYDSDDKIIFPWRSHSISTDIYSGLLAKRPAAFASCSKIVRYQDSENKRSYRMTNKGLSITLPIEDGQEDIYRAKLHCVDLSTSSSNVYIYLTNLPQTYQHYARVNYGHWAPRVSFRDSKLQAIFVKQSFKQPPKKPDEKRHNIRLIYVLPTEHETSLRVRLMEADRETARYTAVSSLWGIRGPRDFTVRVNGNPFEVTKTVFDFLQNARRNLRPDLFWMEPICTLPTHTEGWSYRGEPGAAKRSVFAHATKVTVWLGGSISVDYPRPKSLVQDRTGAFKPLLSTTASNQKIRRDSIPSEMLGLAEVAMQEYWTHLRFVQELYVAHSIFIETEKSSCPIEMLTEVYTDALSRISQVTAVEDNVSDVCDLSFMGQFLRICQSKERFSNIISDNAFQRNPEPKVRPASFASILVDFQQHKCELQRDRVYNLIGISDMDGKLQEGYWRTRDQHLFIDILRLLSTDISLAILSILSKALMVVSNSCSKTFEWLALSVSSHHLTVRYEFSEAATLVEDGVLRTHTAPERVFELRGFLAVGISNTTEVSLAFFSNGTRHGCKLSGLYTRSKGALFLHRCLDSVAWEMLEDTSAVLEKTDESSWKLRISTDDRGALALGVLMATKPLLSGGQPRPRKSIRQARMKLESMTKWSPRV